MKGRPKVERFCVGPLKPTPVSQVMFASRRYRSALLLSTDFTLVHLVNSEVLELQAGKRTRR